MANKKRNVVISALLALALATVIACSPSATAPATGGSAGDAKAGEQAFQQNCSGCHPGGGPAPASLGKLAPDKITQTVRSGKPPMPKFAADKLSDEQLASIVAYLQTLK